MPAIGSELAAGDDIVVAAEQLGFTLVADLAETDRSIPGGRGQQLTVWRIAQAGNGPRVGRESKLRLVGLGIPEAHHAFHRAGHPLFAIGTDGTAGQRLGTGLQLGHRIACAALPQTQIAVPSCRQHEGPVRRVRAAENLALMSLSGRFRSQQSQAYHLPTPVLQNHDRERRDPSPGKGRLMESIARC